MIYWLVRVVDARGFAYLQRAVPTPKFTTDRLSACAYVKRATALAYLDLARDVEPKSKLVRVTVKRAGEGEKP
jgi:hypothetical protein